MRRPLRHLAWVVPVMLLGACAVTRLQAPDITPTSVELVDAQVMEQRFKVGLHVQNPNDRALPIKSVNCALQIEGVEVGRGESSAPFNVPAHGESDFDLIVTTDLASSIPNLAMRLFRGGDMPSYRLSGSVNPDIAWLPPIPFSKSGQLAIPQ
ncbi:MAG: LEA type 2 family protein [Gammaproteobacteria bacterium]|nr:LEA type 2 family protein [Gammaproteobacteria bacterium]MBV8403356.1 LEA type 2 family protein [Gammaproteobacteria bacterium]